MAINRKPLPLHLEIQRHRGNPVGLIRSSYRENGKVKHSTHGRLTGLTLEQLKLLQAAFRGDVVGEMLPHRYFQILAFRRMGLATHCWKPRRRTPAEAHRLFTCGKKPGVEDCLAMIVGTHRRCRQQTGALQPVEKHRCGNCRAWKAKSMLTSIVISQWIGSGSEARSSALPAARHFQDGHLVLYDITSSYFDKGAHTQSGILDGSSGYNRYGKRGHEQIVIALLCSAEGCPVGVEVFAGNTQDASTVPEKIAQLQRQYGLKEIIFVGDRGMITKAVADKIKGTEGLHTISALTRSPDCRTARNARSSPRSFLMRERSLRSLTPKSPSGVIVCAATR